MVKRPVDHARSLCPILPVRVTGWAGLLLLVLAGPAWGAGLPAPVTLDLPIPANKALPTWLGQPTAPATNFATLELPIFAPDPTASLLVTVYFQEKQGGFMRIMWAGTQGAQVLSDNFYEGIGMANQRSLVISPATLIGDGTLTFQCGDSALGIQRIKLEWLTTRDGLVSPQVQDLLVTPAIGPTEPALTLSGLPVPAQPGAWQNQLVTVPMTDDAERIEQGVDFSIDLDQPPGAARLALKETGLPLGKHLIVWINEQRAGTITPAVPDLLDGGYLADAKATNTTATTTTTYVGWRDGSIYLPVSLLKAGINTIQFSAEEDTNLTGATAPPPAADDAPLSIKDVVMQLDYTATPLPATAPATPTFVVTPSLNTGPIEPADTTPTGTTTP